MADVVATDLRDALRARVIENYRDRVLPFQRRHVRLLRARQRDVAVERHPVFGREILLCHVDREQLAVKAIGIPPSAREHLVRVRPRCHADEDAFLRAPGRLQTVGEEVLLELPIDDVRSEEQGRADAAPKADARECARPTQARRPPRPRRPDR